MSSTSHAIPLPLARADARLQARLTLAILVVWAIAGIALTLCFTPAFGPEMIAALASG